MKYVVEVTEKLVKHFVVEADSEREAEDKVFNAHQEGEIGLDYSDYESADCKCLREAFEDDIRDYEEVDGF